MRLQFATNFAIGNVMEVHYYDGNSGPLYHGADKIEIEPSSMSDAREDRKLIELTDQRCLKLAVNQNGRWASLVFHAGTRFDPSESTVVTGTKGTFRSSGPVCASADTGQPVVPGDVLQIQM